MKEGKETQAAAAFRQTIARVFSSALHIIPEGKEKLPRCNKNPAFHCCDTRQYSLVRDVELSTK